MSLQAPWKDYSGSVIREGDRIVHPSGESGVVILMPDEENDSDKWRVDYGEISLSRLCLQIGDKGMAVVQR